MTPDPDTDQIATTLRLSIGLLLRRLRQVPTGDELTLSESAGAGAAGPWRPGHRGRARPARADQPAIDGRDARRARDARPGRAGPDPEDGRRVILSITDPGSRCSATAATRGPSGSREALSAGSRTRSSNS